MINSMINAFVATLALAVIFDVNRKEVVFCGIAGVTAEGVNQLVYMDGGVALAAFISAAAVTALSRVLANLRKMPVTVYIVPGIIPLVPGAGMYNTVFSLLSSKYNDALGTGIVTIETAAAIAIGIVLIFALPNRLFLKRKT